MADVTLLLAMSQRHNNSAVLDAARECAADLGIRRTTVNDVARRAGASRMTVYRLFPDAQALWSALVTREVTQTVGGSVAWAAGLGSARERLVAAACEAVDRLSMNPLVQRILEHEPELLMPYIVERHGQSQRAVIDILTATVLEGMADGSIRNLDADAAALAMELMLRSAVISHRQLCDQSSSATMRAELASMLDRYLRPELS